MSDRTLKSRADVLRSVFVDMASLVESLLNLMNTNGISINDFFKIYFSYTTGVALL